MNSNQIESFQKALIVGASGSGKTTFAKRLAKISQATVIELDEFHFTKNWQEVPDSEFLSKIQMEIAKPQKQVFDGNYSVIHNVILSQIDTFIWLRTPVYLNLWRVFWRSIKRIVSQKPLWHGNQESWRRFFSKENMMLWVWQSYPNYENTYSQLFKNQNAFPNIQNWVCLKTQNEIRLWLNDLNH